MAKWGESWWIKVFQVFLLNFSSVGSSNFLCMESMGYGTWSPSFCSNIGPTTAVKIAAVCQRSWGTTPCKMGHVSKFSTCFHGSFPSLSIHFRLTAIVRFDDEGLLFYICKPRILGAVQRQSFGHPPWSSGCKFHEEASCMNERIAKALH